MKQIKIDELKKKWDTKNICIIDVRETEAFIKSHIPDSINITMDVIDYHHQIILNSPVAIICQSGNRSKMVCQRLQEVHGITAYNGMGGINAWQRSHYPMNGKSKRSLSIMRQVMLVASGILAIGLLIQTISIVGTILIGMVALGLGVSGITGFCLMAKILGRFSWNQ